KYTEEVDPFDGGPHYRCKKKEIKVIKNSNKSKIDKFGEVSEPNLIAATIAKSNKFISTYGQLTNKDITLPCELKNKINTEASILAYDL
ncbi:MAG: hypothetical protein CME61_03975, partial [Halobacteriovoraceae bacterium]|nr:hypothetical protein [Halobacteriovoraceae bacterium]